MRSWSYMLGGLLVWALHFGGMYAIASLAAQTQAQDTAIWRTVAMTLSGACLAACLGLIALGLRRAARPPVSDAAALQDQLAILGGGGAAIAIGWQSLATLLA